MRKMILAPTLLLMSCGHHPSGGKSTTSSSTVNGLPRSLLLGTGFDEQKNDFLLGKNCVIVPKSREFLPNALNFAITINNSFNKIINNFNAKGELGVNLDIATVRGALAFVDDHTSSDLSSTITASLFTSGGQRVIEPETGPETRVSLTPGITKILQGTRVTKAADLMEDCGTHYISAVDYGSTLTATFKIDFHDKAAKERFDGTVAGTLNTSSIDASLAGDLHKYFENTNNTFNISVSYHAEGINALNTKDIIPTGDKIVSCQGQTPDKCLDLFKSLVESFRNYAGLVESSPTRQPDPTKPGENLIIKTSLTPDKLKEDALNNMAIQGFTKASYKSAYKNGTDEPASEWVASGPDPAKLAKIFRFRETLAQEYLETSRYITRANLMIASNDERIDTVKERELMDLRKSVNEHLNFLNDRESVCFTLSDGGVACDDEIKTYNEKQFNVNLSALELPRINFKSWCSDYNLVLKAAGQINSNLIMRDAERTTFREILKATVGAVPVFPSADTVPPPVAGDETPGAQAPAKEISFEALADAEKNQKKIQMNCEVIESAVAGLRSLDLSRSSVIDSREVLEKKHSISHIGSITDLGPLYSLKSLETLNLDGQRDIKESELTGISQLRALKSLSMNRSALTDIAGIRFLPALQDLSLEGNVLTSFVIPRITSVDDSDRAKQGLLSLKNLNLASNSSLSKLDLSGLVRLDRLKLSNAWRNAFSSAIEDLASEREGGLFTMQLDPLTCKKMVGTISVGNVLVLCNEESSEQSSLVYVNPDERFQEQFLEGSMRDGWIFGRSDQFVGKGHFGSGDAEQLVVASEFRIGLLRKPGQAPLAVLEDNQDNPSLSTKIGNVIFSRKKMELMGILDADGDEKDELLLKHANEGYFLVGVKQDMVDGLWENAWEVRGTAPLNEAVIASGDQVIGKGHLLNTPGEQLILRTPGSNVLTVARLTRSTGSNASQSLTLEKIKSWSDVVSVIGVGNFDGDGSNIQEIAVVRRMKDATYALQYLSPARATQPDAFPMNLSTSMTTAALQSVLPTLTEGQRVADMNKDHFDEIITSYQDGIALINFKSPASIKLLPWSTPLKSMGVPAADSIEAPVPGFMQHQIIGDIGDFNQDGIKELVVFRLSNFGVRMSLANIKPAQDLFLEITSNIPFTQKKLQDDWMTPYMSAENFQTATVNFDGGSKDEVVVHSTSFDEARPFPDTDRIQPNYMGFCVNQQNVAVDMRTSLLRLAKAIGGPTQFNFANCLKNYLDLRNRDRLVLSEKQPLLQLAPLSGLDNLRVLNIGMQGSNSAVEGIKVLESLPNLQYLDLRYHSGIRAKDLRSMPLDTLNLFGASFDNEGVFTFDEFSGNRFIGGAVNSFDYCEDLSFSYGDMIDSLRKVEVLLPLPPKLSNDQELRLSVQTSCPSIFDPIRAEIAN